MNVLLVDLGTPRDEISEPLGIETLAPYVTELSSDVCLDLRSIELDNINSIKPYLMSKNYSIIGLSTKIRAYNRFEKVMGEISEVSPNSRVVIGDILGTYAFNDILSKYPEVICVRGEGEKAFSEIVKRSLNNDFSLNGVPNLAYNIDGNIIINPRETFNLFNAKNPLRSLAKEVFKQHGIGRLEASRGCVYSKCDFCGTIEKYNGPGWRPFNLDFVINELITLSNIGFKSPYFTDEDFFGDDINRIYELADMIEESKLSGLINRDLDFYINLRVNSILGMGINGGEGESISVLKRLKEVGLREVFTGIESGCKNQLNCRYNKGTTKQNNIRAINILRDLGLDIDIGFIFFDEQSTIKESRENLNFIYEGCLDFQDSQLIKKLRIEPLTTLGLNFLKSNPNSIINLELVEFPYEFNEDSIKFIYDAFINWQKNDLDVIYNLQSFCRGEVPNNVSRYEIKNIISHYRKLDIDYLNELVAIFEEDIEDFNEKISITTNFFENKRQELDTQLINRINWLNSNYRRFII